ncbi:MAG: hypothetical protein K6C69_02515 [Lachnospiraceae bacterium]|nr:hypothetical protein [Lachnospiraceae bacterium]
MSNKIDQIISEFEEYLDGCSNVPLSSSKIIVGKDEVEEFISELKLKTPDEIKKYQKLLQNRDKIIDDANEQARQIVEAAHVHTTELVNESEIMRQAYEQGQIYVDKSKSEAEAIIERAVNDANTIRFNAIRYTDDNLSKLQLIISHAIEQNTKQYESLMMDLNKTMEVILANRDALRQQEEGNEAKPEYSEDDMPEA